MATRRAAGAGTIGAASSAPCVHGPTAIVTTSPTESAVHFGVVDAVAEKLNLKLSAAEVEQAKTDAYIVSRLVAAIHKLKQSLTESMRVDLHVILGSIAPERTKERDQDGMIRRVAERLGVQRGSRHVKATGKKRPRVLEQAITRRAAFDEALERYGPLQPSV